MADTEKISSDKYTLIVKDEKLYVESRGEPENEINNFWKQVMSLRYTQLENGSLPIVDVDEGTDLYSILQLELGRKGVIYKDSVRFRNFDEQVRDFMIGKNEDNIIVVRQIDGPVMTEDETRLNNFFITMIKAARHKQLESGSEKIPKNGNIIDIVDKQIKKGIVLNGNYISADILYARPIRSRRR